MASLTCPNCGRDNPDFLDDCQFCQTPLRREATLNIGEGPTKKSTGELEGVLPDWLKEARQQARDSAEEEAAKEATKPKIQKEEPLDLLAGLAFQAASDEEEVPDWLAAINPVKEKNIPASPKAADEEKSSDFFAQFEQPQREAPATPQESFGGFGQEDEPPAWMSGISGETQKDELTDWLSQTSDQPGEVQTNWMDNLNAPASQEPAAPAQPEDLSWLHDLEASTKQPSTPATPQNDMGWMSNLESSSGSQEDLSWLNNLGGIPAPSAQSASQPEDMSWLNNLGGAPVDEPKSAQPAASQDDLGWLNNMGGLPSTSEPASAQPAASEEDLSWLNNLGGTPAPAESAPAQEDLSWLNNFGETPAEPVAPTPSSADDMSWLNNLGGTSVEPASQTSASDDLGWLNNLGGTQAPAEPAASQEDMSGLNNLGGTPAEPVSTPSAPATDDMSWLNNLGGTPAPTELASAQDDLGWLNNMAEAPASEPSVEPASTQDDMGWLNNLGGTPAPALEEPVASQPADLNWLDNLSGTSEAPSTATPEPFAQSDDMPDWLKSAQSQSAPEAESPQFSPRQTAPLSEDAIQEMPDWLKSATQESASPSMPPLGATSMDWFASPESTANELKFDQAPSQPAGLEAFDQTQEMPASSPQGTPAEQDFFATPTDSAPLGNQDVDALFAVDMPDWLSQPEAAGEQLPASDPRSRIPLATSDELAPVDLPSWVQAMRPVEAVISETSAVTSDQNTEREGPLAGLRGVIPFAPIGSAQRPKAISLKLQATAEQQAGASLVEQIIASETTAHPLEASPFVGSQRVLRWILTGLFLIVLSVTIALGTQFVPISAALPVEVSNASNVVSTLPQGSPILVVMDYEPSLAGEMEAIAGPLLDQLVVLRQPTFTFLSTSPNGSALVERLLRNTKISSSASDGLGYQADSQYFNLGYLPGGLAGVRGFIESPKTVLPAVRANLFSDFAAVILITDQAESGQIWIEQVSLAKQSNPPLANQSLLAVASAQAGPMLQPYVLSNQVAGMISGVAHAARYEFVNNSRPGIVRTYWDAFGFGLMMAVAAIVLGSLWNLVAGMRAQRTEAEQG